MSFVKTSDLSKKDTVSYNFIQQIVRLTPGIIAVYNVNTGEYRYINESVKELLGYTPEDFLEGGTAFAISLLHPDDKAILLRQNKEALRKANTLPRQDNAIVSFEYRMKHKDGSWRWLKTDGVVFSRDTKGKIRDIMNISIDITLRKKWELRKQKKQYSIQKELREQEESLAFLSEASKILSSSLDYNVTLHAIAKIATPHIADWCGVDIVINGQIEQLAVAHIDPLRVAWAKEYRKTHTPNILDNTGIPRVIKTGRAELYPYISEEVLMVSAKSKKERKLIRSLHIKSAMIVPITIKKETIGTISFIITDSKRRYSQIDLAIAQELANRASLAIENATLYKQAQKEIEERKKLEKQKDEFIGVASHELKTPVTSIKSFTQVLRLRFTKEGNQKAAELLGKLDGQVDKLTNLIGDLLDVTKIEAGQLQFNSTYFSFDELVDEIIEELQRTTQKHMLTRLGNIGKTVYGDRERIGQVITNLVSNAIKYSPLANEVIISSDIEANRIKLCVRDFGVGIPKDKHGKIFSRFYRISGPKQETYPGLGLGLFVSSQIIKRSGGDIWIENIQDEGSLFCFSLPLQSTSKRDE